MNSELKETNGFTLVEIAVVLVVVGLLVGGILVGRDLIRAAELRAQISQIEKYTAAVNTFRMKFDAIPGDMRADIATAFGFQSRSGADGHGDADGLIESCTSAPLSNITRFAGCENVLFWRDLSQANLIDGGFTTATDTDAVINTGQQSQYYPGAKVGGNGVVLVFSRPLFLNDGINTGMGLTSNITTNGTGNFTNLGPVVTPTEAYSMDKKIDDGIPAYGRVRGNLLPLWWDGGMSGVSECTALSGVYNSGGVYKDSIICKLMFRLQ